MVYGGVCIKYNKTVNSTKMDGISKCNIAVQMCKYYFVYGGTCIEQTSNGICLQ